MTFLLSKKWIKHTFPGQHLARKERRGVCEQDHFHSLDLFHCSTKNSIFDPLSHNRGATLPDTRTPPPSDFVKLNVDASVMHGGSDVGYSGVVRDHAGDFIFGFSQKLESCSVKFTMVLIWCVVKPKRLFKTASGKWLSESYWINWRCYTYPWLSLS